LRSGQLCAGDGAPDPAVRPNDPWRRLHIRHPHDLLDSRCARRRLFQGALLGQRHEQGAADRRWMVDWGPRPDGPDFPLNEGETNRGTNRETNRDGYSFFGAG